MANENTHVNQICVKLVKTNAMLLKILYFVNETTLRSIGFVMFHSHALLAVNPLFHFINCAFYRKMLYI